MRYQRAKTDIEVTPIDLTELAKKAFEVMDKTKFPKATRCKASDRYGFVETKQGLFAFDTDGVGNRDPITPDNQFKVAFSAEHDGGGYFFPVSTCLLDDEGLRKLATKERVNLADFIRTFGARLEGNYERLREFLTRAND